MKRIPGTVKKSLTAFCPSPGTKATDDVLYSASPSAHGAGKSAFLFAAAGVAVVSAFNFEKSYSYFVPSTPKPNETL